MKKRKGRVSGVSEKTVMNTAILAISTPAGLFGSHFAKTQIVPMLYKDTDTAEQKKDKILYANIGGGVIGLLAAVGGAYVADKNPEIGHALIGLGVGVTAQCAYSAYVNSMATPAVAGSFDVKLWNAQRNKAIQGTDNDSPGVFGTDNDSPGVFGSVKMRSPLSVNLDEIGKKKMVGSYRRPGSAGL